MDVLNKFIRCTRCGRNVLKMNVSKKDKVAYYANQNSLCYECAYWMDLMSNPLPYMEISKGVCYQLLPVQDSSDKSVQLGGDGKIRYFMRKDLSVIRSNDIWKVGKVPISFLDVMPDTVVEITKRMYNQLLRSKNRCKARGCLNRYMCVRYRIELENDSRGAFNEVPEDWNPKNERCGWFINKNNIIDESNVDFK